MTDPNIPILNEHWKKAVFGGLEGFDLIEKHTLAKLRTYEIIYSVIRSTDDKFYRAQYSVSIPFSTNTLQEQNPDGVDWQEVREIKTTTRNWKKVGLK